MKKCTKCNIIKPEYSFNKDSTTKSGLYLVCKKCRGNYYQRNKDKIKKYRDSRIEITRKYTKHYREDTKIIMAQLKINGCAICGYDKCINALDFHHVNSGDKKFPVGSNTITHKDFIEELQKCVLLCSNCHREITFGEIQNE